MEYPFKDLLPLDEVLEREGYYKDWTHLDPEVFYSLTQISEYIKTKGYGVDVRLLIAQLAEHFGLRVTQITDAMNEFIDLKPKAEQSIPKSAEALVKSQNALNVANGIDAKATNALSLSKSSDILSKSVQEQFNQVVIEGDSSVEAAQARVDANGQTNPTLKARLDKEHNEVTAQLAQTEDEINKQRVNLTSNPTVRPLVTFVDDDGSGKVWSVLKPMFESKGVPCTIALLTSHIKAEVGISVEQAKKLQNLGWEIASHGKEQLQLNDLTEVDAIEQLEGSLNDFNNWGLNVKHFVYPYGYPNAKTRNLVRQYYKSGVNAQEEGSMGLNKIPLAQYRVNRTGMGVYNGGRTLADYKARVDKAIEENGWLIFMTHIGETNEQGVQDIEGTLDYIISKNVDIVTLSEGFEVFGNTLFQGDYIGRPHYDEYNIITKNGLTFKNHLKKISITSSTTIQNFPIGDTHYTFLASDSSGFPGGNGNGAGNLITHKDVNPETGFSYQIFKPYATNELYIRFVDGGGNWGDFDFVSYGIHPRMNRYPASRLPSEYRKRTIEHFYINSSGSAGFPANAGVVTTYRPDTSEKGYIRQEFREYNSDSLWVRHENTDGTWSIWVDIFPDKRTRFLGINSRRGSQPITDYPFGISYTSVNNAQAQGFGDNTAGTITTYRMDGNGYDRQEFRKYNSNQIWSRHTDATTGAWTAWQKISAV